MTYRYHLVLDTPYNPKVDRRPLCGQEQPTAQDCRFWTEVVNTGTRRGFRDYIPPEGKRKFRAILLQDHYNGCHHIECRNICEHCETIAASKKLSPGLYRCDGRLLG